MGSRLLAKEVDACLCQNGQGHKLRKYQGHVVYGIEAASKKVPVRQASDPAALHLFRRSKALFCRSKIPAWDLQRSQTNPYSALDALSNRSLFQCCRVCQQAVARQEQN